MAITKTKQRKKKRKKEARKLAATAPQGDTKIENVGTTDEEVEQGAQPCQCSGEYQLQSFSYTVFGRSTGRTLWDKAY